MFLWCDSVVNDNICYGSSLDINDFFVHLIRLAITCNYRCSGSCKQLFHNQLNFTFERNKRRNAAYRITEKRKLQTVQYSRRC